MTQKSKQRWPGLTPVTTAPLRSSPWLTLGSSRKKAQIYPYSQAARLQYPSSPPFNKLLLILQDLSPLEHHPIPLLLQHTCPRAPSELQLHCLEAQEARSHSSFQVRISLYHYQPPYFQGSLLFVPISMLKDSNTTLAAIQLQSPVAGFHIDFFSSENAQALNGLFPEDGIRDMFRAEEYRALHMVFAFI